MSEIQRPDTERAALRDYEHGEPWLEPVRRALRGLEYGSVLITVQDAVVIQVDRTERRRLRRAQIERSKRNGGHECPTTV